MTELPLHVASDEKPAHIDLDALVQKPGSAWTPDELERYLEHLYYERYEDLITIAQRRLRSREEAEDAWGTFVAENIASVIHAFDPTRGRTISSWVSYKFDFFCLDIARKLFAKLQRLSEHEEIVVEIVATEPSPDHGSSTEAHNLIQRILQSLSPPEQHLFTTRYLEEQSLEEIATELGVPQGTVKSRLYSLRKKVTAIAQRLEQPELLGVWAQ